MALIIVFSKLPVTAMAVYPFIFIKDRGYKNNKFLINHENIHFKQQLELLILPFYVLYVGHYLVNVFRYKSHHCAYLNIVFEKEVYANENDLDYLYKRKTFAWYKWLKA